MTTRRIERDHYEEIALYLTRFFESHYEGLHEYSVTPLLGEISSALRTLIVNGHPACESLVQYSRAVHKLFLDISILIESKRGDSFEIVVFEIKKMPAMGLKELSQLIGYCLVSRARFGILVNVDNSISSELARIVDGDENVTSVRRKLGDIEILHLFGIMSWSSESQSMKYLETGAISTLPHLADLIAQSMSARKR